MPNIKFKKSWWPFVTLATYNQLIGLYNQVDTSIDRLMRSNNDYAQRLKTLVDANVGTDLLLKQQQGTIESQAATIQDQATTSKARAIELIKAKDALAAAEKKVEELAAEIGAQETRNFDTNTALKRCGQIVVGLKKSWEDKLANKKATPNERIAANQNMSAYIRDLVESLPKKV